MPLRRLAFLSLAVARATPLAACFEPARGRLAPAENAAANAGAPALPAGERRARLPGSGRLALAAAARWYKDAIEMALDLRDAEEQAHLAVKARP